MEKELGKNEVFFLPYLMGERSPHNDVNARGAFIGMRPHTTRKEMTLAVLEGVAFALRDCMEVAKGNGIKVTCTRICGGGAKSPLWRQIIADVLGISVETPMIEEGPAYGCLLYTSCQIFILIFQIHGSCSCSFLPSFSRFFPISASRKNTEDVYKRQEQAMERLASGEELSDELRSFIEKYFNIIL